MYACIIPKCSLIRIIAAGFVLIGLKCPHLKLGLFNYCWIRHRSVYCGAALKARFLSYLVVVSSRTLNQARSQSPELGFSASPLTISRTGFFSILGCASSSVDSFLCCVAWLPVSPRLLVA